MEEKELPTKINPAKQLITRLYSLRKAIMPDEPRRMSNRQIVTDYVRSLRPDPVALSQSIEDHYFNIFGTHVPKIGEEEGAEGAEREEKLADSSFPYKIYIAIEVLGHGGMSRNKESDPILFVNPFQEQHTKINLLSLKPQKFCSLIFASTTKDFVDAAIEQGPMFSEDFDKVRTLLNLADQSYGRMHRGVVSKTQSTTHTDMTRSEIAEILKTGAEPLPNPKDYDGNVFCMAYNVGSTDNPTMMKRYSKPELPKESAIRSPSFDHVNWLSIIVLGFKVIDRDGSIMHSMDYDPEIPRIFRHAFSQKSHSFLDICTVANDKINLILGELKQFTPEKGYNRMKNVTRANSECTINVIDLLCNSVPSRHMLKFPEHGLTEFAITVKDIDMMPDRSSTEEERLKNTTRRKGLGRNKKRRRKTRRKRRRRTRK